jgi:hypothetical protein
MNDGFFSRFFAALDSDDPQSSLELVSEDLQFAILFAKDDERRAGHFLGGRDELAAFTDAGDTSGWAHHLLAEARIGDLEIALGETRWDSSGERIGTFVVAAKLDQDGRMVRYLVGRSPTIGFDAS